MINVTCRARLGLAALTFVVSACASGPPVESIPEPAAESIARVQLDTVPAGRGLLYVFNASGPTLIANNYRVKADGRRIADLPRDSYCVVAIAAGTHHLEIESLGRKLEVTLFDGQREYVVVAYNPAKSWGFPILGSPMTFQPITEAQAKAMIAAFTRRDVVL